MTMDREWWLAGTRSGTSGRVGSAASSSTYALGDLVNIIRSYS